jgi:hypothetical protein
MRPPPLPSSRALAALTMLGSQYQKHAIPRPGRATCLHTDDAIFTKHVAVVPSSSRRHFAEKIEMFENEAGFPPAESLQRQGLQWQGLRRVSQREMAFLQSALPQRVASSGTVGACEDRRVLRSLGGGTRNAALVASAAGYRLA